MARVEISQPTVTLRIASEPCHGPLTRDALLDFAASLGTQPLPDDVAIRCAHDTDAGWLTDLWVEAEVALDDLPEAGPDACCPAPDCGHPANRHAPLGSLETVGCEDCDCARSRERVAMLVKASA